MTTSGDLDVLQAIAELVDGADGTATDTAAVAAATGRATFGPPWFELREVLEGYEREGLLRIEAEAPAPGGGAGEPAPAAERVGLSLTDAGRAALAPRNSA